MTTLNIFTKAVGSLVNRVSVSGEVNTSPGVPIETKVLYDVYIGCDPVFGTTQYRHQTKYDMDDLDEAIAYCQGTVPKPLPGQRLIAIVHKAKVLDRIKHGIHLVNPGLEEFKAALAQALELGIYTIFVHDLRVAAA